VQKTTNTCQTKVNETKAWLSGFFRNPARKCISPSIDGWSSALRPRQHNRLYGRRFLSVLVFSFRASMGPFSYS